MRKINTGKKIIVGIALCCMAAGIASAQTTVWNPAANGVSPPDTGDWATAANWTQGAAPVAGQKTVFNVANAAECVVTTTDAVAGQLVMGDGGSAVMNRLRITSGAVLTTGTAGDGWSAISYNKPAHCIVEAGGTYNTIARLGVGLVTDGDGLLEVYGAVNVDGTFQVGDGDSRKGVAKIYDGGTVTATGLGMAGDDGLIDLWQSGSLTFAGDHTNAVNTAIGDGKIVGNRLTNNLDVAIVVDAGETNTVVTATPSVPNLAGLTTNEAAEVLAVFGYIVGSTTEGDVGGTTGLVGAQVPAAGSAPLAPGSSVDLIVQEAGEIPDVVGLDYVAASNLIVQSGYTIGVENETYVFDATPGLVTGQNPPAGTEATPGDPVDIDFYERLAAETTIVAESSGDWINAFIWNPSIVPERETQNYEVQVRGGVSVTLTNLVAMRRLHIGHNGTENGAARLDIQDGGHLVASFFNNYAAIGWNAPAVVNVYTNGIFESLEALRVAWINDAVLNIDGGKVISANWMSLGSNDGSTSSETTIQNGGSLEILRFNNGRTNGVITMYEGTFKMFGTGRVADLQAGLDAGTIKIADGYSYTLSNASGDSVITSYLPGYDSWANTYDLAPGSEDDDPDGDLANNLYEYGLNGDPTNSLVTGSEPVLENGAAGMTYTHLIRSDDSTLEYIVEYSDDLVHGTWTNMESLVTSTNDMLGGDYDAVTNAIPTTDDKTFLRLRITNP